MKLIHNNSRYFYTPCLIPYTISFVLYIYICVCVCVCVCMCVHINSIHITILCQVYYYYYFIFYIAILEVRKLKYKSTICRYISKEYKVQLRIKSKC